jgi:hypothetical protein
LVSINPIKQTPDRRKEEVAFFDELCSDLMKMKPGSQLSILLRRCRSCGRMCSCGRTGPCIRRRAFAYCLPASRRGSRNVCIRRLGAALARCHGCDAVSDLLLGSVQFVLDQLVFFLGSLELSLTVWSSCLMRLVHPVCPERLNCQTMGSGWARWMYVCVLIIEKMLAIVQAKEARPYC